MKLAATKRTDTPVDFMIDGVGRRGGEWWGGGWECGEVAGRYGCRTCCAGRPTPMAHWSIGHRFRFTPEPVTTTGHTDGDPATTHERTEAT
ncbi:hypothetical protein GCM10027186_39890 [Micromonospora schwarzwaldensis]